MTYLRTPRQNTLQRIAAMRRVTKMLASGEMLGRDIRKKMHISESGCRKYLNALMAGAIIVMARREATKYGDLGQPVYKLSASPAKIEQFFNAEASVEAKRPIRRRISTPGRLIHLLSDDAPFPVACNDETVTRDPFALPVEFFRSAEVRV